MKVLNIGSMNLDRVYQVDHMVQAGETLSSQNLQTFLGGKGMNQSVALAKAGVEVYQGGMIGADGGAFLTACAAYGVDTRYVQQLEGRTGHAIIQVDAAGQNCILLYGGANQMLTEAYIDEVVGVFSVGDVLMLQNEVNLLPYLVARGHAQGMTVVLNPSPFDEKIQSVDLEKVSLFLLNEVEGEQLTGARDPQEILQTLCRRFPQAKVVLTLGGAGAYYADAENMYFQPAFSVDVVDTTAAGDTFTGYFVASWTKGLSVPEALRISAKAAAIAVSRTGAVPSIPALNEVLQAL